VSDTVIVAIISSFSSVVVALITVTVKDWFDDRKKSEDKSKEETIGEVEVDDMVIIHDWVENFRVKYKLDTASIYQFHNGGKFFHGRSMKKFSMTYESVAAGYQKSKRIKQNILASDHPKWISTMLRTDYFSVITDELELKDRTELMSMGIKQAVIIPIRSITGDLIGFIEGCNISKVDKDLDSNKDDLIEESIIISGYLHK
jgi:hypothetical protein